MGRQEEVAAIPLVEERLAVSKRQVESGRLRVRISVEEREEQVPVELTHDEWMTGVHFINAVGQCSNATRNEAHRVSDVLGLES